MGKKPQRKKTFEKKKNSEANSEQKWINNTGSLIIIVSIAISTILYLWKIIFSGEMLPGHPKRSY